MSKCTTWKDCVKNMIKTFKKKHPKQKIQLKNILKMAKVQYAKEKKTSPSTGKSNTKKRKSSSRKRKTRKNRK